MSKLTNQTCIDIWNSKEIQKEYHPELGEVHIVIKMIKLQINSLIIIATKYIQSDYIDVDYYIMIPDEVISIELETN